jgi:hypothetical protein
VRLEARQVARGAPDASRLAADVARDEVTELPALGDQLAGGIPQAD